MADDLNLGSVRVSIVGDAGDATAAFDTVRNQAVSVAKQVQSVFDTTAKQVERQLDLFASLPLKQGTFNFGELGGRQLLLPLMESAERLTIEFAEASEELSRMRAAADQLSLPFGNAYHTVQPMKDQWDLIGIEIERAAASVSHLTAEQQRALTDLRQFENHWDRIAESVESANLSASSGIFTPPPPPPPPPVDEWDLINAQIATAEASIERMTDRQRQLNAETAAFENHWDHVAESLEKASVPKQSGVFKPPVDHWDQINEEIMAADASIERLSDSQRKSLVEAQQFEATWERINDDIESSATAAAASPVSGIHQKKQRAPYVEDTPWSMAKGFFGQDVGGWFRRAQVEGKKTEGVFDDLTQSLGGGSNRAAMAITQVGFAVEDFLTVVGTSGLSGGLRAAGNNMSFLASNITPIAGLLVGVGVAGAALVYQLMQMEEQTDLTEDAFRKLARTLSIDVANAFEDVRRASRDSAIELPEVEQAIEVEKTRFEQQRADFQKMMDQSNRDIEDFGKDRANVINRMRLMMPDFAALGVEDVTERVFSGGSTAGVGAGATWTTILTESAAIFERDMSTIMDRLDDEVRAAQADMSEGNVQAVQTSLNEMAELAKKAAKNAGETDFTKFLPEGFKDLQQDLLDTIAESETARNKIGQIGESLKKLGEQEEIYKTIVEPLEKFTSSQADAVIGYFKEAEKQQKAWDKQQEKSTRETIERQKEAMKIVDDTMTPLEKFKKQFDDLVKLQEEFPGLISDDVFQRQTEKLQEEFAELTKDETKTIKINFEGIDAVGVGTAEGLARLQGMMDQQLQDRVPKPNATRDLNRQIESAREQVLQGAENDFYGYGREGRVDEFPGSHGRFSEDGLDHNDPLWTDGDKWSGEEGMGEDVFQRNLRNVLEKNPMLTEKDLFPARAARFDQAPMTPLEKDISNIETPMDALKVTLQELIGVEKQKLDKIPGFVQELGLF
jgi:hypothetical protein